MPIEPLQVARGGHHVTLVIITVIIQLIKCDIALLAIGQQLDFVVKPFAFEICVGFRQRDLLAAE